MTKALVVLVRKRFPAASLDRVLFFHAAKADPLLHDVVTEILVPLQSQGTHGCRRLRCPKGVGQVGRRGANNSQWSEPTIVRVAQGFSRRLRDFGVLQGAVNKRIAPAYLPVEAFAYLAFYLKQHSPLLPNCLNSRTGSCSSCPVKVSNAS